MNELRPVLSSQHFLLSEVAGPSEYWFFDGTLAFPAKRHKEETWNVCKTRGPLY